MNDNLSASFVLMAGAALLGYWFYHLSGDARAALLANARNTAPHPAGPLAPYLPTSITPANPGAAVRTPYGFNQATVTP